MGKRIKSGKSKRVAKKKSSSISKNIKLKAGNATQRKTGTVISKAGNVVRRSGAVQKSSGNIRSRHGTVAVMITGENIKRHGIRRKAVINEDWKSKIPADQLNLPIGYSSTGTLITLNKYQPTTRVARTLETMPFEKQQRLVIARIKANESYPTRFMVGVGKVDKEKALQEVEQNTPAGKFIMESERRVIARMRSIVENKEI